MDGKKEISNHGGHGNPSAASLRSAATKTYSRQGAKDAKKTGT